MLISLILCWCHDLVVIDDSECQYTARLVLQSSDNWSAEGPFSSLVFLGWFWKPCLDSCPYFLCVHVILDCPNLVQPPFTSCVTPTHPPCLFLFVFYIHLAAGSVKPSPRHSFFQVGGLESCWSLHPLITSNARLINILYHYYDSNLNLFSTFLNS